MISHGQQRYMFPLGLFGAGEGEEWHGEWWVVGGGFWIARGGGGTYWQKYA
jgi:hypothetical protein